MPNNFRYYLTLLTLVASGTAVAEPMNAVLRLKETIDMQSLAASVRSPVSLHYQTHYTPQEIAQLAGPSAQEYSNLLSSLQTRGFQVVKESPTHLWISVKGDHTLFEKTFATRLQFAGSTRKPLVAPQVPADLSLVAAVTGFDNTRKVHHNHRIAFSANALPMDGIPQSDIKTHYGFDKIYASGITGKGQHIAVATYDGFMVDDVNTFYKTSKLNPTPTVDQVQFNGTPAYNEDSAMETQLDAEFSGMIAPGASVHVFASAENSDAGELAMFTAILDDNRAQVANYSWGGCEKNLTAAHQTEMEAVFARAEAQGVNITVASGDTGSDGCRDGSLNPDWPASNTHVVAVGGTSLTDATVPGVETGWDGSGGGISTLFDLPKWQTGIGAAYTKRSYPDVSFNADPATGQQIWAHYTGTAQWITIGGTSMAAPQWAGFLALVAEARANAGKAKLGFLNPHLYGLSAADQATAFFDVTSGNNGAYDAAAGWDAVTGLGTLHADVLLNKLNQ